MNAVPFDTLKPARKLEASGMAGPMAAGTAEALAEVMIGSDLATKADIANLRTATTADIAATKVDIASLRTELKIDIASLRTELKTDIAGLRAELKMDIGLLSRDIVIKFGSMMVVTVGILLAAIRYLPPHP
jgi:hypothetical protein